MQKGKSVAVNVGVSLGADVMEYLKALEISHGCSRSFLINSIIREFAERQADSGERDEIGFTSPALAKVIEM